MPNVALGLRDGTDGEELEAEIAKMGRRSIRVAMDVRDLAQITTAVDEVVAAFGHLDILVNNAGLGPENKAEDVTEADFDLAADPFKGVLRQAAGKAMIRQGFGRIINLSSQAGLRRPADGVGLLRIEGGDLAPDEVPRRRVGQPRHHRQRRGTDVHPHTGHQPALADPAFHADVVERIAALHRIGEPNRRRRRGRLPRLTGRRPDHRHDADRRRRLDRPLGPT